MSDIFLHLRRRNVIETGAKTYIEIDSVNEAINILTRVYKNQYLCRLYHWAAYDI